MDVAHQDCAAALELYLCRCLYVLAAFRVSRVQRDAVRPACCSYDGCSTKLTLNFMGFRTPCLLFFFSYKNQLQPVLALRPALR